MEGEACVGYCGYTEEVVLSILFLLETLQSNVALCFRATSVSHHYHSTAGQFLKHSFCMIVFRDFELTI